MSTSGWFARRLGLYVGDERLNQDVCVQLRTEASCAAETLPSTVYRKGGGEAEVNEARRRSRRVVPAEPLQVAVEAFLAGELSSVSEDFWIPLAAFEDPQLLRYREGDFFARDADSLRHDDGSLPASRRVSMVVALSEVGAYTGGEFVVLPDLNLSRKAGFEISLPVGTMLGFESDLPHEIRPVRCGERYSIVTWAS